MHQPKHRILRRLTFFVFMMLVIEYLDEFAYSILEVARPLIRDAFALTYVELGLITTIPILVAIIIEPIAGLFADTGKRRWLIIGGGLLFGIGLIIQSLASLFWIFMIGATIQAPASGIFVNLAQASLVDDNPQRRENRMALWTFSGSLAVVTGPAFLALGLSFSIGWLVPFFAVGLVSLITAIAVLFLPSNQALRSVSDEDKEDDIRLNIQNVVAILKSLVIWRWLALLQFSDLMLDVLFSLLALYMVDVVGVTQQQASLAVIVWTGIGLIGDFLLIPLLEHVRGLSYLRVSAAIALMVYPAMLLVDSYTAKLILLGVLGLFNAGWYAILQSQLYDALGEQSGAVLIVGNAAGIFGALLPVFLGFIAQIYGLNVVMWLLLAAPIVLLLGLPRQQSTI